MNAPAVTASSAQANRGTIFVEDAEVIDVATFPGDQFVIRLKSPNCAARAQPGSFVHIQCDEGIPMRRPLSIMRANTDEGWIEVLFKIVGEGLRALGDRKPGDTFFDQLSECCLECGLVEWRGLQPAYGMPTRDTPLRIPLDRARFMLVVTDEKQSGGSMPSLEDGIRSEGG